MFELLGQPPITAASQQTGDDALSHTWRMHQNRPESQSLQEFHHSSDAGSHRSVHSRAMPERADDELLTLALEAARAAGSLLLERFQQPATGVERKSSSTDMVSDADRDAEVLIRGMIGAARPLDAILGEEGSSVAGRSGLRWVVDPLDGTTNYLYGLPIWSVSVACEDADGCLVGVVLDPSRDELFAAQRGRGATLNGRPIRVSPADDLSRALIGTGFSYAPAVRGGQARALVDLLPRVRDIRRGGSAAIDLAWVACGRLDGYYELGTHHWDRAAGMLLVSEAGGISAGLDDPDGEAEGALAAGPALYDALCERVAAALRCSDARDQLH
ncbi:MAG: monophosphatase [Gaiellales bacterium]|nr:monophosphatase [Gaiellales bacterium]